MDAHQGTEDRGDMDETTAEYPGHPDDTRPGRGRLVAIVAGGCVAVLVLAGLAVGGTWWLLREDPGGAAGGTASDGGSGSSDGGATSAPSPEADSPTFVGVAPYEDTPGDATTRRQVLEQNPLTEGELAAIGDCTLPDTPTEPSAEELQSTLDASADCLDQVWAQTSSNRDLPWTSPEIVVYTYPDVPVDATCDPESFAADYPRPCNLDNTIYWPIGYGHGASLGASGEVTDPQELASAYLFDLAEIYATQAMWHSSVGMYYVHLAEDLEGDPEAQEEVRRRYRAQLRCLGAAASMQVNEASRPSAAVREAVVDPGHWEDGSLTAETSTHWTRVGLESEGDMAACNAWTAPAEDVA